MLCVNSYWVLPDAEIRRFGGFAAAPLRGKSTEIGGMEIETDTAQWTAPASMAPIIIPGTMTAGLMWKTVNTLMPSEPEKMCTGTATVDSLPRNFGKIRNSRISALKKLSGCITTSIIPTMWMPRIPGTRIPGTTERNRTVEDLLKNNKTCPEERYLPDWHHGRIRSTGYSGTHCQRILRGV